MEPPAMKNARERQKEQRQAQRAAFAKKNGADQRPIGSTIEHGGPLDAWTKLAQALFQANEAMFIN
jgi:alkylhydroperoxidase/carboxymuconolactone decarboxylase family protein YurZ